MLTTLPPPLCSPDDAPCWLNSTAGHAVWKPTDVAHLDLAPRAEGMVSGVGQVDPWDQTVHI